MLKTPFVWTSVVFVAIALMLLGGCAGKSQPTRFYTLASRPDVRPSSAGAGPASALAIGVGPVRLADYLDQSRIVTRTGDNRIGQAEFDQWSGSFKDNFTNVLAENIGAILGTERVSVYPWRSYQHLDYQVAVDVVRFDGQLGQEIVLIARWSVLSENEKKLFAMRRSDIREKITGTGYGDLVEAQNRALAVLSNDIAGAILAAGREKKEGK